VTKIEDMINQSQSVAGTVDQVNVISLQGWGFIYKENLIYVIPGQLSKDYKLINLRRLT
jgi:hypothetical protein